ncbi:MAG: glycosyltransferase family 2 protein [Candidatus Fermentibacter sp.]|nr:glycosyltransferase family 2 protein [Candidatus Fermentibacter sp.]
MGLSVAIIALDEENDLPGCLASVGFADEVVLVDSGSADATPEIAREAGARVLRHPFTGFSEQKQYACDSTTGDWILVLDADERAGSGLREAVSLAMASGSADAYRIARRTVYMGRVLRFGPWGGDRPLRLFRRGCARFGSESVHESLRADSPAPVLRGCHLEHRPYRDFREHMEKMARYASLWAAQEVAAGRRASGLDVLLRPQWRLFRGVFLQLGLLDGVPGLAASFSSAVYAYWKYMALFEITRMGGRSAGPGGSRG